MATNFSPSVNIVRDAGRELDYLVTTNAEKTAVRILNDFNQGFHSFTVIGSFGTGKSSFLWAFEQSLSGKQKIFDVVLPKQIKKVDFINIVGEYHSIEDAFHELFQVNNDQKSNAKLFQTIGRKANQETLLVIVIDEFGKFLEYAGKHQPEKEMYFIQQLAEFVNDPTRNILLITTLHQSVDSYAYNLTNSQKNEWKKINGRFKELVFNEPIEQLLTLAATHFKAKTVNGIPVSDYTRSLIQLQLANHIFGNKGDFFEKVENDLYPLDIFSAYMLTLALQKYGQNERSLFSFLQSENNQLNELKTGEFFMISAVYDYLYFNFYSFLNSKANPDFAHWYSIKEAIGYVEVSYEGEQQLAIEIVKTIGLFQIFGNKGSTIDAHFFQTYFQNQAKAADILKVLETLEKKQIIRFNRFAQCYRIYEGSDFDIDEALNKAENQIERIVDIVPKLRTQFDFPLEQAKAVSYKTGTPRLFEYVLSSKPINTEPVGEIDGFINLIFSQKLSREQLMEQSAATDEAIVYVLFEQTQAIEQTIFEIDKIGHVLKSIKDDGDKVAIRELESLKSNFNEQLNNQVQTALYTEDVSWYFNGVQQTILSKKEATKLLSRACEAVYHRTPILQNELFNKHKVSTPIAAARKNYFDALVKGYETEDLGFSKEKFPPEKTIYISLLRNTGIHSSLNGIYSLGKPQNNPLWMAVWEECERFLASAKEDKKPITELYELLQKRPYKLKLGVLDFWITTFLFIRRGDYALYSEGTFKPYVNEDELYLITRNPKHYTIKSFELNDLRLSFFNKYRAFLQQQDSEKLSVSSFIESIRPILLMYRKLNHYAQTTKRISMEAQRLRDAIAKAQDLEKVFFDDFPSALGVDIGELLKSEHNFDNYILKFQETISEIGKSYDELLNRIELFIQQEVLHDNLPFEKYKKVFQKQFASIKDHQLLPLQKTFLQRINSPMNDRDSWLASIGQTLIGKPLTQLSDNDEEILKEKFKHTRQELLNLLEIQKISVDSKKEEVFKIDFTSHDSGTTPHFVRIPKKQLEAAEASIKRIQSELGTDKELRIALLAKLLKDELNK